MNEDGRPRLLFCTNRYRTYDHRLYETLAESFKLHILWINPPPRGEPIPEGFPGAWSVLADDSSRLTPRDIVRTARLLRLATRLARESDLVVASTSSSWKTRILYAAARAGRTPFAVRTDIWRDNPSGMRRTLRASWQRLVTDHIERHSCAVLVSGVKAAEYAIGRGVARERVAPFRYLHPDFASRPRDERLVERLRGLTGGRVTFLYLGRIMPQKGLVPLIEAFRGVLASGRDACLLVVGEPITSDTGRGKVSLSYYEEARRSASSEQRIHFLGAAAPEDVHNYYAASDVFVHPHVARIDGYEVHEGWGNVITEAASMSKAIVATDRIPACFDIVTTGRNGFLLCAERLETDLPSALTAFIDDPGLVARFGAESRKCYEAFADPTLNIHALERVISRARAS